MTFIILRLSISSLDIRDLQGGIKKDNFKADCTRLTRKT